MKNRSVAIALSIVLGPGAILNAVQNSLPAGQDNAAVLENGTVMYLELSKSVDARKAKVGDEVSGVLLADVVSHGKVVARRDSKLIGHVTEAQAHSKEVLESRLGIAFDKVLVKGGNPYQFNAVLLALSPAPRLTPSAAPGAPVPPGMNPASAASPERHYPMPKGPSTPKGSSVQNEEMGKHAQSVGGATATEIEDLNLTPAKDGAGSVIVSFKRTVKLEDGVRMELRVTQPGISQASPAR